MTWKKYVAWTFVAALVIGDLDTGWMGGPAPFNPVTPAEARIGHPLTPLSYAGVARRTTRRVVRRTAIYVTALPAGCVYEGSYYVCGSLYYQRYNGRYVQVYVQ